MATDSLSEHGFARHCAADDAYRVAQIGFAYCLAECLVAVMALIAIAAVR